MTVSRATSAKQSPHRRPGRWQVDTIAVAGAVLTLSSSAARAGDAPSPPAAPEAAAQRVEVVANGPVNDRREANAAKSVVSHEDLTRYGDRSLADALQRVSGITVVRAAGKDAEIRLRGMGSGYTQILVDGQPVPAGFSIESLSPELIDHVDVLRSATADLSTQSIAGTINIVTRRPRKQPPKLKVSAASTDGRPSGNLTFDVSERNGPWSWGLGAALGQQRDHWPSTSDTHGSTGNGQSRYGFTTTTIERDRQQSASMTSQLGWRSESGDTVGATLLLQDRHITYFADDQRDSYLGTQPDFASDDFHSVDDSRLARAVIQWKTAIDGEGRLDSKLTLSSNSRRIGAAFEGRDASDSPLLDRNVHSTMHDDSVIGTGKYSLNLGDDHTLGLGWDGQAGTRREHRIQQETSEVGYPTLDLDEDYKATIERVAVFVQDEWTVSESISAYLGIRWEGLRTRTTGDDIDAVKTSSSVFSPTFQAIWKVPDTKSDQVRFAVGRTYKAPTARDLVPRRWVVNQNGPTTPDFRGNPALLPELAWGLDTSYEHYLSDDGIVTLGAYMRRIKDVVIRRVNDNGGIWTESPENAGNARVAGLEFEAKGKLRSLFADSPDLALRIGATRNWSRIDAVPGPGNRLTQQPIATVTTGLDWHVDSLPLTLGTSFVFEHAGYARTAETQSIETRDKRLLDVYGVWKINARSQLRMSATNLLAQPTQTVSRYFGSGIEETNAATAEAPTTFLLRYETSF